MLAGAGVAKVGPCPWAVSPVDTDGAEASGASGWNVYKRPDGVDEDVFLDWKRTNKFWSVYLPGAPKT